MKVKFNLKNVYYAKYNKEENSYETPVPLPGAVSLTLDQQGELSYFYADGIKYYTSLTNNGYEGDLEMALIPDQFRKDILSEVEDKNKVLFEKSDVEPTVFALGFQVDGDECPTLFWFYSCTTTRAGVDAKTTEDTKEPDTDSVTISAAPNDESIVRAKTTKESYAAVKDSWFKKVYVKNDGEAA